MERTVLGACKHLIGIWVHFQNHPNSHLVDGLERGQPVEKHERGLGRTEGFSFAGLLRRFVSLFPADGGDRREAQFAIGKGIFSRDDVIVEMRIAPELEV